MRLPLAGRLRQFGLVFSLVLLCLEGAASAPAPMVLIVEPPTGINATQTVGQPAKTFTYRLTASRGNITWSYSGPSWLRASAVNGKTPANVTLTTAAGLQPGAYTGVILFQFGANGITRPARLTVSGVVTPPPTGGCYLLGNVGTGYLTTKNGERLTC